MPLELGMIAGALVNGKDIGKSLFTPGIPFPAPDPSCKAASFFAMRQHALGAQFIRNGAKRIIHAVDFVHGEESRLKRVYERERLGWEVFYDVISAVQKAIQDEDGFALELKKKTGDIVEGCTLRTAQDILK